VNNATYGDESDILEDFISLFPVIYCSQNMCHICSCEMEPCVDVLTSVMEDRILT
jgi:hypothetical protein